MTVLQVRENLSICILLIQPDHAYENSTAVRARQHPDREHTAVIIAAHQAPLLLWYCMPAGTAYVISMQDQEGCVEFLDYCPGVMNSLILGQQKRSPKTA